MPETGLSELEVMNELKILMYTHKIAPEETKTIYSFTKECERNLFQNIILPLF